MRVIRPRALSSSDRRRSLLLAATMLAAGIAGVGLALVTSSPRVTGLLAIVAALGLGIGGAWLLRVMRPSRSRTLSGALVELLATTFDDSYTLLVSPRLPIRDTERLDGVLIGPGGVRILTARDWHGRYRLRGRVWEFDARGTRGWIRCRTNPSFDANALRSGFLRWAADRGFRDLPLQAAVAFPLARTRVVLEEPEDEVITADNAPWWANSIGRVRRLDEPSAAQLAAAVIEEAERHALHARSLVAERSS